MLVAGLVGLLVAVGALVALGVDVAVRLIPPEVEARVFPEFPGGGEPSPDPRREAVQLLLERLAARWPEAPYQFRVRLLADAQVNAAALPGGSLLVTVGLLDAVGSENELAFVLAHELGHFAGRHHLRRLGRRAVYGLALAALTGHGGTGGDLGSFAGELTSRGFDRSQEREADAFGLGLLAGEYGHVAGAAELFAHFGSEAPAIDAVVAYFSTHPAGRDRIEALTAEAASRGWSSEAELRPLAGPLAR
jgi:predicted Zn-dependent protease